MLRPLLPLIACCLLAAAALPAREADDPYRQLLDAVAYRGITLGTPSAKALAQEGGFQPFFLSMNACTRRELGAPFLPATELLLITSPHTGHVVGMSWIAHSEDPAELVPLVAIKARLEAIYRVALPMDGEAVVKDRIHMQWQTRRAEGVETTRVLTVYDIQLREELGPPKRPAE
jgi:hypothetical protein